MRAFNEKKEHKLIPFSSVTLSKYPCTFEKDMVT